MHIDTPTKITEWLMSALPRVSKPTRYLGLEVGSKAKTELLSMTSMAFAFPDVYEVGMSHLGIKILYNIINDSPHLACERVFAPWPDMETLMRQDGVPLFSMESRIPVNRFDTLGFTLQYELSFTNIVNMLDLAFIPAFSRDRDVTYPIVVGGGPIAYNAEPLADFFDCFLLGDGEESIIEFLEVVAAWKRSLSGNTQIDKGELYKSLSSVKGCYVPNLYHVTYFDTGIVREVLPCDETSDLPRTVTKRIISDLNHHVYPRAIPVPYMDIVHDRIMLEVMRGCSRGCRFCQAGMVYRPVRERSKQGICELAGSLLAQSGYEEISLSSLSTADHSLIGDVFEQLLSEHRDKSVSVSLPSLRADAFSIELAKMAQAVRKTGLTFAPEAGTQRLRDVINKNVTEDELLNSVSAAFRAGWNSVKLYFMIGLPTETDDDIVGIAELTKSALFAAREAMRAVGRRGKADISVSVSSFVPKSHTPFQWFGQNSREELERKQRLLADRLRIKGISLSWHDSRTSYLEAVFARGDRKLSQAVIEAWRRGCKFDGWEEYFKFDIWIQTFEDLDIDMNFYANRHRSEDEVFPWDHLSAGLSKEYLRKEWHRAAQEQITADCRDAKCCGCGVCSSLDARHVIARSEGGG